MAYEQNVACSLFLHICKWSTSFTLLKDCEKKNNNNKRERRCGRDCMWSANPKIFTSWPFPESLSILAMKGCYLRVNTIKKINLSHIWVQAPITPPEPPFSIVIFSSISSVTCCSQRSALLHPWHTMSLSWACAGPLPQYNSSCLDVSAFLKSPSSSAPWLRAHVQTSF